MNASAAYFCADRKLLVMTCSHGDVYREGLYDLDKCQIVAMLPDGEHSAFNRDSLRGRDTLMAILRSEYYAPGNNSSILEA